MTLKVLRVAPHIILSRQSHIVHSLYKAVRPWTTVVGHAAAHIGKQALFSQPFLTDRSLGVNPYGIYSKHLSEVSLSSPLRTELE